MEEALAAIGRDGHSASLADRMATFKDREEIVGTRDYLDLGPSLHDGVRPPTRPTPTRG